MLKKYNLITTRAWLKLPRLLYVQMANFSQGARKLAKISQSNRCLLMKGMKP